MSSKYFLLPDDRPRESDEAGRSLLGNGSTAEGQSWHPTLRNSILATVALVLYSLGISWVTKVAVQGPHQQLRSPASNCKSSKEAWPGMLKLTPAVPHPDEKEYIITTTGQPGESWVQNLVYGEPSPELDDAWFDLLKRTLSGPNEGWKILTSTQHSTPASRRNGTRPAWEIALPFVSPTDRGTTM
jgi:hypothetical protein